MCKASALALASTYVERLLRAKTEYMQSHLVETHGGDLLGFSTVVTFASPGRLCGVVVSSEYVRGHSFYAKRPSSD